ncbi:MAG: hypothetical protein M3R17_18810 [Bacteroidota bacterium]|nr:hypothetical protein [Bacteroidota bacterium]
MKPKFYFTALLLVLLTGLQSCAVVGGIFKAGAVTGIIAVVLVVGLIIFLLTRMGKK